MTKSNWIEKAKQAEVSVHNFVDGARTDIGCGDRVFDKHSARDGSLLYQFNSGSAEDVDHAVANARKAFEDGRWSELPLQQRKAVL